MVMCFEQPLDVSTPAESQEVRQNTLSEPSLLIEKENDVAVLNFPMIARVTRRDPLDVDPVRFRQLFDRIG